MTVLGAAGTERERTSALGREWRDQSAQATVILAGLFAVAATGVVLHGPLVLTIWVLLLAAFFQVRFGLLTLWHPAVLLWWLGIVPSVFPLYFYTGFDVGVAYHSYNADLLWMISLSSLAWGIHLASPSVERRTPYFKVSGLGRTAITRVLVAGFVLISISIAAYAVLYARNGNAYLSDNPEAQRVVQASGSGLIGTVGFTTLILASILLPAGVTALRRRRMIAGVFGFLLMACALMLLSVTGGRTILLRAVLVVAIILVTARGWTIRPSFLLALGSIILALIAVLGSLRYHGEAQSPLLGLLQRLSVDPQVAGAIVSLPGTSGYWHGQALLSSFAVYLPGSNPALGDILKNVLLLSFSGGGVSTPLPAEAFLDFGWLGVFAYPFLAGITIGLLLQWTRGRSPLARLLMEMSVGVAFSGLMGGLGVTLALYALPQFAVSVAALSLFGLWARGESETRTRTDASGTP